MGPLNKNKFELFQEYFLITGFLAFSNLFFKIFLAFFEGYLRIFFKDFLYFPMTYLQKIIDKTIF
jgi:hypothetical protein